MPSVATAVPVQHERLSGVTIFPIAGGLEAGKPQRVLVRVAPDHEIPLHTHVVDAKMFVVAGTGRLLSPDELDGRPVGVGELILFEKDAPHGFRAGPDGLSFLSENGGIVDGGGNWDIQFS